MGVPWTKEATSAAQFLAGFPAGNTTLLRKDLQSLQFNTGGQIMARGSLYNICAKSIGGGVSKVWLVEANPPAKATPTDLSTLRAHAEAMAECVEGLRAVVMAALYEPDEGQPSMLKDGIADKWLAKSYRALSAYRKDAG